MINLKILLKSLGLDLKAGRFLSTPVALRTSLEESVEGEVCVHTHTYMQATCFSYKSNKSALQVEYFVVAVHTVPYWAQQVQLCSCCFVKSDRFTKN